MDLYDTVKHAFSPAIALPIFMGRWIAHLRSLSSKSPSFEQADQDLTCAAPTLVCWLYIPQTQRKLQLD